MTNQAAITEARNPATTEIDRLSTREIVATITEQDARVAPAVAAESDAISRLADEVVTRMQRGGRLIYAGAGTSGRLGVLDAVECLPTYGVGPDQIVALLAGGPRAMTASVEAAEDKPELGAQDIAGLDVGPNDVVLGIAASGRTPYVLGAVAEARQRGAFTAGLACARPSTLEAAVDLMIAPIVGPEVVTGSTRMKAGTAQKMVLNTLSTTVMIRLGKTFGNLMVDVQPTNEKLRRRTVAIVAQAAGIDHDTAHNLLQQAGGQPKTAIVMALAGVDAAEAQARLDRHGGHIRQALQPTDA